MPELILGPLLRHISPTDATVWVETDTPCGVEVLVGDSTHRSRTFRVGDHHYRLAGIEAPAVNWRLTHGKHWFENHVATLELDGRRAKITFEEAVQDDAGEPGLRKPYERRLV